MRKHYAVQLPSGRRELAIAVGLGTLGTAVTIVQMTLLSDVLGGALLGRQHVKQMSPPLLWLLGAVALRALLAWREEVSAQHAGLRLTGALRERLFDHLLQLGPGYLQRERSGELATTAIEGVDRLLPYYQRYLPVQALSLIVPALIILFLVKIDLLGALLLLVTAPVIPLLMVLIGSYTQTHVQRHWLALSRLGAQFLDTLQGLPTLLLFGRGEAAAEQVRAASTAYQERTMQVLRVAFLSGMVLDIMIGMAIGLVAVVVAIQLLAGSLPFASALLVLLLAPECYRPLREMGAQRHTAMEGKAGGERILEVLQEPLPVVAAPARSKNLGSSAECAGRQLDGPLTVELSGVTYCYQDGHRVAEDATSHERAPANGISVRSAHTGRARTPALRPENAHPAIAGVTLTLPAGRRTALVGRSGAGKSTLVNLLMRFLDPQEGTISVNGVTLAELSPHLWRTHVALVPQQPHLFSGTIAENLLLARPEATMADLEWAAEQAGAAEFIARLPGGYAAPVGEEGALLSAGQVQRLAIARAFLKDAPLLILDEPTSALDPEHEIKIHQALDRLMAGRTVLVAAHRLNTILGADQIAVLEEGRLVETGSHRELLERGGAYAVLMGSRAGVYGGDGVVRTVRPLSDARDGPPTLKRRATVTKPAEAGWARAAVGPAPSPACGASSRPRLHPVSPRVKARTSQRRDQGNGCANNVTHGRDACIPGADCSPLPPRLLALLHPHAGRIVLALLLGVLTGVAGAGLLAVGAYLIGAAALGTPLLALGIPIMLVRLFGVGRGITRYAERLSAHRITFALLTDLRVWCYRRLLPLVPARLSSYRSGDLLTRLVQDVADLEGLYLRVVAPSIVAVVVSVLIVLFFVHFVLPLAGTMLGFLLLAGGGVPWLVDRWSHAAQAEVVRTRAALQAQLVDVLQGMTDLLALGREAARRGGLSNGQTLLRDSRLRLAQVAGIQRSLATLLAGGTMWTVLVLAIRLSGQGALQPLFLPLLTLVALVAIEAVQPLGEAFAVYRGATASAERVAELLDATPAVADPPRPRPAPAQFAISFEHITFSYQPGAPAALRDVSFEVAQGSRVAIVGPSGAGKTTLVNLLVRFWDPDEGSIGLGCHDLREYALHDLRRSIGVVSQRTTIFNDTLRRNLLLARPEASDRELLQALERARLADLVAQSPQGLDRWVGEQGVQLSGGERQRLAIARTLLLDAPVLVLDEPTANLDPATERELLDELHSIMVGRTTISITHRLVGLEHMDEILVLDGGQIVERGTHGHLLVEGGLYRRLIDVQEQMV